MSACVVVKRNQYSTTMRDIEHTWTGSDYYFSENVNHSEFTPESSCTRKIFFLPSQSSPQKSQIGSPIGNRIYIVKDQKYSSANFSPRSNGTNETSKCATDGDLDSHCGSLAYSVESWGIGHFLEDEYRDDDNAKVDHLLTPTAEEGHEHEVFNPCFRPLSWAISLLQESLKKISSFPDDILNTCDCDRRLQA